MPSIPCGTKIICDDCLRGEHEYCVYILGVSCLEHRDPVTCKCNHGLFYGRRQSDVKLA